MNVLYKVEIDYDVIGTNAVYSCVTLRYILPPYCILSFYSVFVIYLNNFRLLP